MKSKGYLAKFVAATISMTSLFAMPLCAADQKPVLEVEDAVKSAIVYSNDLSLNSQKQEVLKEQFRANSMGASYYSQLTYLQKTQNEQQKKMIEDSIANDVTNQYNKMIILEKEINQLDKNIAIAVRELRAMQIKSKNGPVNPILYQTKEIEVENLKITKYSKANELKNAQDYFKLITGKDLTNYCLDKNIAYEFFRIKGSVEGYVNSKIDTYLQYDKEISKLIKDNPVRPEEYELPIPLTYSTYLTRVYDANKTIDTLEQTQKSLRKMLIDNYSILLSLEEQIGSLQLQSDILDKKIKSTELWYKAGMINVIEYDKQIAAKQDLELKELSLLSNYNSLKETIQKPWVNGVSSKNQGGQN